MTTLAIGIRAIGPDDHCRWYRRWRGRRGAGVPGNAGGEGAPVDWVIAGLIQAGISHAERTSARRIMPAIRKQGRVPSAIRR